MRISDWSSDVCSSDLLAVAVGAHEAPARIVEIEPAAALRHIVERLADGGEVGEAARLRAEGGGGGKDDLVRCDIVFFGHRGCNVPESGGRGNKHVIFRVHDCARRSLASGTNRDRKSTRLKSSH